MTRRCRILLSAGIVAGCVCIVLGVLAMLPPSGVTKANFERMEPGMTLAEVEVVFGERGLSVPLSPRLKALRELVDMPYLKEKKPDGAVWESRIWSGDKHVAEVTFVDGRVYHKRWSSTTETALNKLRRWLHLPK